MLSASVESKSTSEEDICQIIRDITNVISIEPLSLAKDLDAAIHQCVPFKYHHIANMLKQAFNTIIQPSILQNMLFLISSNNVNVNSLKFFHEVNVHSLLSSYSLNESLENKYAALCSPILLTPFRDTCPNCNRKFQICHMKWKKINIFFHNGMSEEGIVLSYTCNSLQCFITVYSNHYRTDEACISDMEAFNNTPFYYYGGCSAYEKSMLNQFGLLLSTAHTTFFGFTDVQNLMPVDQCSRIDRRKFETDFLSYEWIKYSLFLGKKYAFTPRFSRGQNETSFDKQFENILRNSSDQFTRFWSKMVIQDTNCLIVDGTWKLRRVICSNKSVYRNGLAFDLIETGCPNTPSYKSIYCDDCKPKFINISKYDSKKEKTRQRRNDQQQKKLQIVNALSKLSCNVKKDDIPSIDLRERAMGVLIVATDKNIILDVAELVRSESRKEVLDLLTHVFKCNPNLPRTIVYDAGCLLQKYVQNQWSKGLMKVSPATKIIANARYLIDRFHLTNHKKRRCQIELNPDSYDDMANINTQSCEQINRGMKYLASILNNTTRVRHRLLLLILCHYHNCRQLKIKYHLNREPFNIDFDQDEIASSGIEVDRVPCGAFVQPLNNEQAAGQNDWTDDE